MSTIHRLQVRATSFVECPTLQVPLNSALITMQEWLSDATDGLLRLYPLPPVEVVVSSNSPGTLPWPLQLAQVAGAPLGATLIRIENLTTAGSAGVPTSAVSITSQHVEGGTVLIDFISGLTLNSRYRMVFGVYNA
jgi:hypothetical protein